MGVWWSTHLKPSPPHCEDLWVWLSGRALVLLLFLFFETGFLCVALTVLELTL